MGRRKIPQDEKNVICSVSLIPSQKKFIEDNLEFDFSKFVQLKFSEYINDYYNSEFIEEERRNKNE